MLSLRAVLTWAAPPRPLCLRHGVSHRIDITRSSRNNYLACEPPQPAPYPGYRQPSGGWKSRTKPRVSEIFAGYPPRVGLDRILQHHRGNCRLEQICLGALAEDGATQSSRWLVWSRKAQKAREVTIPAITSAGGAATVQ